jgi:hypothetical protein
MVDHEKSYARFQNWPDNAVVPSTRGALSRGIAWVGRAGGTRWRCAADTSGAGELPATRFPRPAGMPVPGDPGLHLEVTTNLPPGAWLTAAQKQARCRKHGPGSKKAAAGRREARRLASLAGDLRRSGDRLDREAGHRVRRFRTSACRRSAPLIFSGSDDGGKRGPRAKTSGRRSVG